jgi:hypothetical protein
MSHCLFEGKHRLAFYCSLMTLTYQRWMFAWLADSKKNRNQATIYREELERLLLVTVQLVCYFWAADLETYRSVLKIWRRELQ